LGLWRLWFLPCVLVIGCSFLVQLRSERLTRGQASHSGYRHSGPECAGSSHTLYQVCWRRGVWCCEPFGYGPYCLHPSGCPMEISAVGLSVECTLQKVTLDSVVFLALMFGGFLFTFGTSGAWCWWVGYGVCLYSGLVNLLYSPE
jgi:hypothetical protein